MTAIIVRHGPLLTLRAGAGARHHLQQHGLHARDITALPGLIFALCGFLAVPLLLIQPAMSAGIASRNTPTPLRNSLKSLATHSVFGLGLYLSAALIAAL